MHIDAIKSIIREHKVTLEINPLYYRLNTIPPDKLINHPDDWFMRVHGNTISHSLSGFLTLTRRGLEANTELLQQTLEQAIDDGNDPTMGQGWAAYEKYANSFYGKLIKENEKKLRLQLQNTLKITKTIKNLKPLHSSQDQNLIESSHHQH